MNDGNRQQRYFARAAVPSPGSGDTVAPAQGSNGSACGGTSNGSCTCSNGGTAPSRFVYVLGTVDCQFPDQSVSEEFQEVARSIGVNRGNENSMKQRDDEPLRSWVHRVLTDDPTKPGPRYIARQLCWVLLVEQQQAYYLTFRDWQDLDDLIECLGEPSEIPKNDLIAVVGSSSLIPVETCPGFVAPVLQVEQVSAYKFKDLVSWCEVASPTTEKPTPISRGRRRSVAQAPAPPPSPEDLFISLFRRIVQAADNFGDDDQWRALNFLAVRYKPLYQLYAQKIAWGEYLLDSVRVVPSRLWRERRIVDPVFTFVHRDTGTLEKYFVRVDVTHLFPFMLNHIEFKDGNAIPNYFDR